MANTHHEQNNIVRRYLMCLEAQAKGNTPSPDKLKERIVKAEQRAANATSVIVKLDAIAERMKYETQLAEAENLGDISDAERRFIEVAKTFAERKAIPAKAFKELGVPAKVLAQAEVS